MSFLVSNTFTRWNWYHGKCAWSVKTSKHISRLMKTSKKGNWSQTSPTGSGGGSQPRKSSKGSSWSRWKGKNGGRVALGAEGCNCRARRIWGDGEIRPTLRWPKVAE